MRTPDWLIRSVLLSIFGLVTSTVAAQSLAEVIALHQKRVNPKKVSTQTMVLRGKTIITGMPMEFPTTVYRKTPHFSKVEVIIQRKSMVKAFDGKVAWKINPFPGGSNQPERLSGPEELNTRLNADFDYEFINAAHKGHQVTLEGVEEIGGTDCYKIKVIRKDKHTKTYFLDKETGLLVMARGKSIHPLRPNTSVTKETYWSDYKVIDGVVTAHYMEERINGEVIAKMQFDQITLNEKLDNKMFAFPNKQ